MSRLPMSLFLFAVTAAAQAVAPPFNATWQTVDLGLMPGVGNYGGTAFLPGNPNVLLVSTYLSGQVRAVQLARNAQGYITGFAGSSVHATVSGTDGGLAVGPGGVLFGTWYGANRLYQIRPGSSTTNRVDDLSPLGVAFSVGGCAFVPPGLPGAGRLKVAAFGADQTYELPLTPDGTGTFAPGTATSAVQLSGGIEGLVYVPAGTPLLGGQLLVAEWSQSLVSTYQIDGNGNPIPATRQVVIAGTANVGGGAVDPITGDVVFAFNYGRLLVLRNPSACGTYTAYGPASPGALGTPSITGAGCVRTGQTVGLTFGGWPNAIGVLAAGNYAINVVWNGLTVLQSLDATFVIVLDGAGTATLPLAIPAVPSLANQHFYLQSALLGAGTPSGFAASAGLDMFVR